MLDGKEKAKPAKKRNPLEAHYRILHRGQGVGDRMVRKNDEGVGDGMTQSKENFLLHARRGGWRCRLYKREF